jgi:hypothetical protein
MVSKGRRYMFGKNKFIILKKNDFLIKAEAFRMHGLEKNKIYGRFINQSNFNTRDCGLFYEIKCVCDICNIVFDCGPYVIPFPGDPQRQLTSMVVKRNIQTQIQYIHHEFPINFIDQFIVCNHCLGEFVNTIQTVGVKI